MPKLMGTTTLSELSFPKVAESIVESPRRDDCVIKKSVK